MRGDRPEWIYDALEYLESPPRARGSTHTIKRPVQHGLVSPACGGIDLWLLMLEEYRHRLPRVRGDRPESGLLSLSSLASPPRARGSTFATGPYPTDTVVSPACAGIDPLQNRNPAEPERLPRVRGDRPYRRKAQPYRAVSPPRARGSTCWIKKESTNFGVSPACAGIDLTRTHSASCSLSLPRVRGDRPYITFIAKKEDMSPPRARGSTLDS